MSQKYPVPPPDKYVALSTACVGCGPGGGTPMIARVAVVDYRGRELYFTYVSPTIAVTDYRTKHTGIKPEDLEPGRALPWATVQQQIGHLIKDKIIVGYTLWQDLSVIGICHPAVATRDVALYQPFRNALQNMVRSNTQTIGLHTLMWLLMRRKIQDTQTCPLENARAAMDLYRSRAEEWEGIIAKGQWPTSLPPSTFSRCYT
ncbi:ribonuclease H-like domain-containing protein [Epithele typhae]|uniref:ribonuclease H-like domain-containing protein n=1 Tax=Epithele typhae TaxID=378194 RepID=UPI00200732D8|nr:ribonuclease H-like domain-containing protein [Epithele typhae]KAH9944157.1 ribonuclease H-like domain-containing protein [Epithele typhae]